eukprot:475085-Pyramimonas_sp.AAC.1
MSSTPSAFLEDALDNATSSRSSMMGPSRSSAARARSSRRSWGIWPSSYSGSDQTCGHSVALDCTMALRSAMAAPSWRTSVCCPCGSRTW